MSIFGFQNNHGGGQKIPTRKKSLQLFSSILWTCNQIVCLSFCCCGGGDLTKTSGNYIEPTTQLSWEKPKRLHFAQSWCNFNPLWQLTRLSWESCHSKLKNKNKKTSSGKLASTALGCAKKGIGLQTSIFDFSFSVRAQGKKMECIITKLSLISWAKCWSFPYFFSFALNNWKSTGLGAP